MRFDHYQGLSPRARRLINSVLAAREEGVRRFANGRVETFVRERVAALAKVERIGRIRGQYNNPIAGYLHRYTMIDGRVYEEYIQQETCCGGPHFFIALKTAAGRIMRTSLWSEAQMHKLMFG